ncbi:acyltransferase [Enterococcus bulliens]
MGLFLKYLLISSLIFGVGFTGLFIVLELLTILLIIRSYNFKKCGKNIYVTPGISFYCGKNIEIGDNVSILNNVHFHDKSMIIIGSNSVIGSNTVVGDNTIIENGSYYIN